MTTIVHGEMCSQNCHWPPRPVYKDGLCAYCVLLRKMMGRS